MLHQIVLRPQSLCQPEFELCARCDVRAPPPFSMKLGTVGSIHKCIMHGYKSLVSITVLYVTYDANK